MILFAHDLRSEIFEGLLLYGDDSDPSLRSGFKTIISLSPAQAVCFLCLTSIFCAALS